ncbi:MAG TPA: adenylyltransferase/cytidyltransferase family protein [Parcubacteria group bacterium]|nr:adenylyltransferase/cytidyltransferase family protein [Parcubacteria group bacterium]
MTDNKELAARLGQIVIHARKETDIDTRSRFLQNDDEVRFLVDRARNLGLPVVLTQGTFDLVHIGHARYVREAKNRGHLLIVGIDDDEKARERKGENRPVVPFIERCEMMCHLRYVDAVAMKKHDDPKWHMIKLVRPDVLVAVEGTYSEEEKMELEKICDQVVVLPRQAETSTSAKVRTLVLDGAENLTRILAQKLPDFIHRIYQDLKKNGGA